MSQEGFLNWRGELVGGDVLRDWLPRAFLEKLGRCVPADVGLIQLEWRPDHGRRAGMDQHNDFVGEAAVDMLVGMVNGERGSLPPPAPR